jgi:hypothetical protein
MTPNRFHCNNITSIFAPPRFRSRLGQIDKFSATLNMDLWSMPCEADGRGGG